MTLDQLRVMEAIVRTGSFRAAADELHRAQSAVSYSIKSLEDEIGFAVFDRSAYRPQLSEQGRAVYLRAKALLSQSEQLSRFCQQLAQGCEPEIRLSTSFICPMAGVIPILKDFSAAFPETNLKLAVTHMEQPIKDLLDGQTDLAISDLFDWDERLLARPWTTVRLLPVAAPSHPLVQSDEVLPLAQVAQYTQVIVSTTTQPEEGRSAGILQGAKQWMVTQFPTKKEILKAGLGWGFMPDHLIAAELDQSELKMLPHLEPIERPFYVCRLKAARLGPASQYIWDRFLESVADTVATPDSSSQPS
jgi:DNA-binding transcriptional LysR family regulator